MKDVGLIQLERIEWFDARGKKKLYVADHIQSCRGKYLKYSIDIWAAKDGRILTRFHSKCDAAQDDISAFEIKGLKYDDIPQDQIDGMDIMGRPIWVPKSVFDDFERWAYGMMPFIVDEFCFWRVEYPRD